MNDFKDTAMEEIWSIKDECWREVAHLPLKEAVRERLRSANSTAKSFEIQNRVAPPIPTGARK